MFSFNAFDIILALILFFLILVSLFFLKVICKSNNIFVYLQTYFWFFMIKNTASLDLVEFVEQNILPRYASFDKAHGLAHVNAVIKRSIELVRSTGADINMVYVVAAYHDLGLSGPRAVHHITGGKILQSDVRLKRWFSSEQIKIMKEAVEDHRASASRQPRSIYGKIVAEADRCMEPETVIRRIVQYGLSNYPSLDREGQWKRLRKHIEEKYSVNGYIKLWIQGSDNERELNRLRSIIADEALLRQYFDKMYDENINYK